jgi:hypothetical protein
MISEVVNAIFITYVASEYLVVEDLPSSRRRQTNLPPVSTIAIAFLVLLLNILDRITGAREFANDALQGFLHLPRILFAASAYVVALYIDIRRRHHDISIQSFSSKVAWAFCKILPAYPFLAVLISFVFLFVINLWEALHLPLEWLNAPIYYGTLYGPFAWVYLHVKRQVCEEASSLPA